MIFRFVPAEVTKIPANRKKNPLIIARVLKANITSVDLICICIPSLKRRGRLRHTFFLSDFVKEMFALGDPAFLGWERFFQHLLCSVTVAVSLSLEHIL